MPSTLPLMNFTAAAAAAAAQQQQSVFADVLLETEDNNFGKVPATSLFASLPDEHESLDSSFSNSSWEVDAIAFGSTTTQVKKEPAFELNLPMPEDDDDDDDDDNHLAARAAVTHFHPQPMFGSSSTVPVAPPTSITVPASASGAAMFTSSFGTYNDDGDDDDDDDVDDDEEDDDDDDDEEDEDSEQNDSVAFQAAVAGHSLTQKARAEANKLTAKAAKAASAVAARAVGRTRRVGRPSRASAAAAAAASDAAAAAAGGANPSDYGSDDLSGSLSDVKQSAAAKKNLKRKATSQQVQLTKSEQELAAALELSRDELLNMTSEALEVYAKRLASARPLTADEQKKFKRQRRLIKNRESAQLSRMRKKAYVDELEKQIADLNEEKERFRRRCEQQARELEATRIQATHLRSLISQHPALAQLADRIPVTQYVPMPPTAVTSTASTSSSVTPPLIVNAPRPRGRPSTRTLL